MGIYKEGGTQMAKNRRIKRTVHRLKGVCFITVVGLLPIKSGIAEQDGCTVVWNQCMSSCSDLNCASECHQHYNECEGIPTQTADN